MTISSISEFEGRRVTIIFDGALNPAYSTDDYLRQVVEPPEGASLIFDFSRCTRAFPNSMLPILCDYLVLKQNGFNCSYIPPDNAELKDIFLRTGISHYFDPSQFEYPTSASDRHLAAVHVRDASQQHSLVSGVIDLLLRSTPLNASVLDAFRWIFNEISGNIFDHANSPVGGFVQLDIHKGTNRLSLCVCDPGDGIAKSIKSAGHHGQIKSACEAVEHAIRRGVTRDPSANQGNGLAGSLALAKAFSGRFAVRSDDGFFVYEHGKLAHPMRQMKCEMFGTLVDVQLDMNVDVANLGEIITDQPDTAYEPHSVIQDEYLDPNAGAVCLKMTDETFGFGNREAGKQMRQKSQNLINNTSEKVIVDWTGVPLISSSFADEFIGKLYAELGPLDFSSRVVNIGMDKTTKHILNVAMAQRLSQRAGFS